MTKTESIANDAAPSTHPHDRRDRLSIYGPSALSDVELVSLILGGRDAMSLARNVIESVDGLSGLLDAMALEIGTLPGVGPSRASSLVAAVELGRRLDAVRRVRGRTLRRPAEVADFVRGRLRGAQQEHFLAIGLDSRQRVKIIRTVAIGSLSQVEVHPREIFRPLVRAGVHSCVLVHNHPSGDAEPSQADVDLTLRMVDVGRLMGIPVLDHVILTDSEPLVSMAALGLMG